ncbi:FtsK/SpoIIIE family DNA translocase [Segatella albensis]|jgi:S-DNA-T family DNA segregation ATPase FtsK/SpoIIIE|uniref:FtsK/SpoIIIE family DNA translocase n=1 Tax=Segatella albensis TaxID=77768 RepID=UPI0003F556DA|nr:DNA translocase FtsK [Segatella albensis]
MAKKKTARKPKTLSEAVGFQNIFNSEKTDFFLGVLTIVLAVYFIIAMISYFNTGCTDQSILEDMRPGEWMNTNQEFANYCGSVGAIISYFFIAQNFGIPAFFIPIYMILAALKLMKAYTINLWKWFFGMMLTMIWCSVTFAKFLSPILGDQVYNAGGNHGLYIVQTLENLIGPPGLTLVLLVTALAFLTYLTSETITIVRKLLNPIGYISNKVKFTITTHHDNDKDPIYEEPNESIEPEEAKDFNDPEPSPVIDLDELEKHSTEDEGGKVADKNNNAVPSLLQTQREARLKALEETSKNIGMQVSVAGETDKATGNTVSDEEVLKTPINPREPFTRYKFPTLNLLKRYEEDDVPYIDEQEQIANKNRIIEVLGNFGVQIKTIKATVGPTITLYEIQPAEGVRISKIKNLEDDIALSLAALGIRIIAPIPGKGTIGIEVPNAKPRIVSMESILNSKKFQETKMELPIALGKTITNEVFMVDLAKIPHLLVAGATGQGKSVGLNAIITSLLYKKHPNELKFVLIDPKKVEFSVYTKIAPHFMAVVDEDDEPIITDVTKVVRTLNSLCKLMDSRYDMLKLAGARNIKEYNAKFVNHRLDLTKGHDFMPYIVVIIDEFGDLIMTAGKEIELPIARIAQLARAVGIHMVIATQRPTTSIITGNIKANFPGRIAFKVSAGIDSKTILDRTGAQQLIGRGDMLYLNGNEPVRVQCAFVDTPEVERINEYIADQPGPVAPLELPEPTENDGGSENGSGGGFDTRSMDPYFEEAAHAIVLSQSGSTSMIQRRFSIGYNRAGRLMDQLEAAGIVGAAQGSKPREVLVADENQLNALIAQLHG